MSTEEERAALLRAIAVGGFSPWLDQDGSTANTLLEMAEALAPMSAPPPHRKRGFLYTFMRHVKRVYLRLRLRAKLRWLGLVPVIAVLWAVVEVRVLVAQSAAPADSLIMTKLVRDAIGEWQDGVYRATCLTWWAEKPERPHLLFLLDAAPADTTVVPVCGHADGYYPLFVDAPTCPPEGQVNVAVHPFILVRCGQNEFARYRRVLGLKRT
jgi:hypothetical protein